MKLKKENPELFEQKMAEHKREVHAHLQHLKETDPEAYQKAMKKRHARMAVRLKYWKTNDPEKFKEVIDRRNKKLKRIKSISHPNVAPWATRFYKVTALKAKQHPILQNLYVDPIKSEHRSGGLGFGPTPTLDCFSLFKVYPPDSESGPTRPVWPRAPVNPVT